MITVMVMFSQYFMHFEDFLILFSLFYISICLRGLIIVIIATYGECLYLDYCINFSVYFIWLYLFLVTLCGSFLPFLPLPFQPATMYAFSWFRITIILYFPYFPLFALLLPLLPFLTCFVSSLSPTSSFRCPFLSDPFTFPPIPLSFSFPSRFPPSLNFTVQIYYPPRLLFSDRSFLLRSLSSLSLSFVFSLLTNKSFTSLVLSPSLLSTLCSSVLLSSVPSF